ncbi:kinase-like domain-containing protein [Rhizoctonia solani]|nr:kinase-like domain-containing protein [Rhizoctonia solani]
MKPSALETLKLLRDTAAGLSYIHKLSVVHGDLKDVGKCAENWLGLLLESLNVQVNVVVEQPGKARVCDFGSAHILGCTNCIAGPPDVFDSLVTQRYLSPEIRRSGNCQTTKQSDVWALGCVLLEAQTGVPPYKSNNDSAFGWIRKQLKGDYPAERSVFASAGSISVDVGEIAFRCWERDPDKRPQAQHILEDLEHLCAKYDVPEIVPQ